MSILDLFPIHRILFTIKILLFQSGDGPEQQLSQATRWLWVTRYVVSQHVASTWLSDWGQYKMVTISQTTFSNTFSWMKMYEFRLRFHWILFLRVQSTIFQHWSSPSHHLTKWRLIYRRIYASTQRVDSNAGVLISIIKRTQCFHLPITYQKLMLLTCSILIPHHP